ncbi:hypothetical protein IV203_028769 [Nitzschia inconspicua]|uniref:Uncharacterized protein n=1 Tax=Nitzschia inconspicua TaxID=303405 RepID=A0A9K3LQK7_9STRA|nr:hypothetical protein IV203_028769 [Nitzschia inconspicua]
MPPNNTMTETLIRVDDSTRRKLAAKTSASSTKRSTGQNNKSAIDAALGKFTDEFEDDIAKRAAVGRKEKNDLGVSEHSSCSSRPRRTTSGSRRSARIPDPLAESEHSTRRRALKRTDDIGVSEHSANNRGRARPHHAGTKISIVSGSDQETGFEDLKDDDEGRAASKGRSLRTGRKKTDRERNASPGPVKRRPSSLGPLKERTSSLGPIKKRTSSPGPIKHAPLNPTTSSTFSTKQRSSSLGPVKHMPRKSESLPSKKRAESPGPLKKRSESPGPLRKRTSSVGALSRRGTSTRLERVSQPGDSNGELENMLSQVTGSQTRKRGARSVASAPAQDFKRPELRPSISKLKQRSVRVSAAPPSRIAPSKSKSVDGSGILDIADQMSARYDWQGYRPTESQRKSSGSDNTHTTYPAELSEGNDVNATKRASPRKVSPRSKPKRSMSALAGPASIRRDGSPNKRDQSANIANEIAKQKVKRHNSMAHTPTHSQDPSDSQGGPENGGIARSHSMMLHREMTRRGKSNSLMDLVQYKEEEIHSTSYFASNHVLVNRERMKRGLRPLTRNIFMDELARKSAKAMADSNGLNPLRTTYVGNVLRGESIRSIHRSTMQQKQGRERANLLNPYFQEFGVGTCKGTDGMLYMCQLFSERLELALTDTTT